MSESEYCEDNELGNGDEQLSWFQFEGFVSQSAVVSGVGGQLGVAEGDSERSILEDGSRSVGHEVLRSDHSEVVVRSGGVGEAKESTSG